MSVYITEAQVKQYASNIRILFQQQGSLLRSAVRTEALRGKYRFFDRLGATTARRKTTRHAATPLIDSVHSRRRAEAVDFEWADLLDPQDEIRILISPASSYVVNAAWALGRAMDSEIITAFNRDAVTGEDGGGTAVFPAGQVIAAGGTGLTIAKLREAMRMLDVNKAPTMGRYLALDPYGKEDLLSTTEVTSADFNTVRALVNGEINSFLGFQFIMIPDLLPNSGGTRSAFAWQESAMGLVLGEDIMTRVDPRVDLSMAMQVYARATFGAVRVEDEGVIQINYV